MNTFQPFLIKAPLVPIPKGTVNDSALRRLMKGDSADSVASTPLQRPKKEIPQPDMTEEKRAFVTHLVDLHQLADAEAKHVGWMQAVQEDLDTLAQCATERK